MKIASSRTWSTSPRRRYAAALLGALTFVAVTTFQVSLGLGPP